MEGGGCDPAPRARHESARFSPGHSGDWLDKIPGRRRQFRGLGNSRFDCRAFAHCVVTAASCLSARVPGTLTDSCLAHVTGSPPSSLHHHSRGQSEEWIPEWRRSLAPRFAPPLKLAAFLLSHLDGRHSSLSGDTWGWACDAGDGRWHHLPLMPIHACYIKMRNVPIKAFS